MDITDLREADRKESIELVNQFFRQVNRLSLDGLFRIRPRAATKFVDVYLKLAGTDRVYFRGIRTGSGELVSLAIARLEEKPFLVEERTMFLDIAVTKRGHQNRGYMSALVRDLEDWCRKNQIPSLELRAIRKNEPAVNFWQSQNFEEFYIRFRKRIS